MSNVSPLTRTQRSLVCVTCHSFLLLLLLLLLLPAIVRRSSHGSCSSSSKQQQQQPPHMPRPSHLHAPATPPSPLLAAAYKTALPACCTPSSALMNNIKNILGPLGSIAAAVGVISTVAGSAMSVRAPTVCSCACSCVCSCVCSSVHVSVHLFMCLFITSSDSSGRYDVDGGQRAVLFQKFSFSGSSGVQQGVVGEGTHFLVPWFQQAIM